MEIIKGASLQCIYVAFSASTEHDPCKFGCITDKVMKESSVTETDRQSCM